MTLIGIINTAKDNWQNFKNWFERASDRKYYDNYFENLFLEGVELDIKILENAQSLTKYEKENDVSSIIAKKYKESYCPSLYYPYFSKEDKERYFWIRIKIDKALSEEDYEYYDK